MTDTETAAAASLTANRNVYTLLKTGVEMAHQLETRKRGRLGSVECQAQ